MLNQNRRRYDWRNNIQSYFGTTAMHLQQAREQIELARSMLNGATHEFTEDQQNAVDEMGRTINLVGGTIEQMLVELETIRVILDSRVEP